MKAPEQEFESAVQAHYTALYRFAFSLTRNESDAADLTQSTFQALLKNLSQVRELAKVKSWLFTSLYRAFLQARRHEQRFPKVEVDETQVPAVAHSAGAGIDAASVAAALDKMEEPFRSTLILFYMEEHSYREIAEILEVPIGTVMSRLARGKALLQALLADRAPNIVPFPIRKAS